MTTYMPRSVRSRLTRGVLFAVALVVSMLIFAGTAAASVPCGHGVEDDGANVYLVEYFCDEDTGAVVTIKRTKIGPSPPGPKPSPPGNDFPKIGPPAQVVLPVPIPAPVPGAGSSARAGSRHFWRLHRIIRSDRRDGSSPANDLAYGLWRHRRLWIFRDSDHSPGHRAGHASVHPRIQPFSVQARARHGSASHGD